MAEKTFGTKLYVGGTGTPRTGGTAVETASGLTLPEGVAKEIETTSHDSTKAEFILSYVDEGEVGIEGDYTAATGQEALRALLGGDASNFYVNYQGGSGKTQLYFSGLVKSWNWGSASLDGKYTFSAKIKITGALTRTTQ